METKTALIRSDCRVKLHPVTSIGLHFTVIINPCNLESKDTLWFYNTLYNLSVLELRMLVVNFFNRLQHFMYCLEILLLVRILGLKFGH